ncbi:MAG: ATP-binding cassette domain-containing protein [Candidatus Izemoplasma sp.]
MLVIKNLTKVYQSKSGTVVALKNIDLEFPEHGFIFMLGKSGSGKSTLLNIIGGLDDFDRGSIYFKYNSNMNYKNLNSSSYRNINLGFVFQDFNLIDDLTIEQNVALPLELQGLNKEIIAVKVNEILSQVNLTKYIGQTPKNLSGGEKQKLAIARALIKKPKVILCDEVTGNLDTESSLEVIKIFKKLSGDILVIFVTHESDYANKFADRIIELVDGKIYDDYLTSNNEMIVSDENDRTFLTSIKIPDRMTLTTKNIEYINSIIKSNNEDIYISFKNDSTQKATVLNEKAIPKTIKVVKASNINNQVSNDIKNPKLPFKSTFKFAKMSILKYKLRLVSMLILFVMSLTFFGVIVNIISYEVSDASYKSFTNHNITYIPFERQIEVCNLDSCIDESTTFTEIEINTIKKNFPGITFFNSYKSGDNELTVEKLFEVDYEMSSNGYYAESFSKITITNNYNNDNIIVGEFVQDSYGVLITDYMALMLLENNTFDNVNIINEIVGQSMFFNNQEVLITGILDTDFEQYEILKTESTLSISNNVEFLIQQEAYTQLFMSSDTFDNVFNINYTFYYIEFAVFLGIDENENLEFLRHMENINTIHKTSFSNDLYNVEDTLSSIPKVIYLFLVFFALLTGFLIYNFISYIINNQKKEIGILRALGIKRRDVAKIYLIQGIFIATITGLFSSATTVIITNLLNNNIMDSFDAGVVWIYTDIFTFYLINLMAFVMMFLAVIIPTIRITLLKPIEAIKGL